MIFFLKTPDEPSPTQYVNFSDISFYLSEYCFCENFFFILLLIVNWYIVFVIHIGIINGTLHRDTWKLFGEELSPGCVLILKNVGVFSIGVKSFKNQHYLTITVNNLVSLYTLHGGNFNVYSVLKLELLCVELVCELYRSNLFAKCVFVNFLVFAIAFIRFICRMILKIKYLDLLHWTEFCGE